MHHHILRGLVVLLLAFPGVAAAQQPEKKEPAHSEMDVDLPDETEETSIVAPGVLQIETAVLRNSFRDEAPSIIGQMLVRYGVSDRLELRALVEDGRHRDRYMEETVQATYPLAASAKFIVLEDHDVLPDITLVGYLKLPFSGRSRDQNAYWSPILLAAFQHSWGNDRWKLEYNAGAQQDAYDTDWTALGNASLHYKVLKAVEIFAEYYAQFQPGEDPLHNVGGGLAWQLGQHFECYGAYGTTVNTERQNTFATAGIACRF